MKTIRNLILKTLGLKNYLSIVSQIYLRLVLNGFLKKKYPELFFLNSIIKPGFVSIDIGANLGYYSTFLSKITGASGKVYAVEPVPLFGEIWKKNIKLSNINNLQLFPFALGAENKKVKLGLPMVNGVIHHGMTKVADTAEQDYKHFFECDMRIPNELFKDISRIDFIKCDVEGYEQYVFANLTEVLKKHKPLIQCELGGDENRNKVISILEGLNYTTCILKDNSLLSASKEDKATWSNDFYFVMM
jgi:FkbM family methyltransferase